LRSQPLMKKATADKDEKDTAIAEKNDKAGDAKKPGKWMRKQQPQRKLL